MIATIVKVLFVCSIFSSWAIASDFNIAILRPEVPVEQISYKEESELLEGLKKITKERISEQVASEKESDLEADLETITTEKISEQEPLKNASELEADLEKKIAQISQQVVLYSAVIFASKAKFELIMGFNGKSTELYERLVKITANIKTEKSTTVTSFMIIECPNNKIDYQLKLFKIIKELDQYVIHVPLEASILEQLKRSVSTAAKNIRTEFRKCLYDFGKIETTNKVDVTSFTTLTDTIQKTYTNSSDMVAALKEQFRILVDGLGAYAKNIRTYVMFLSAGEYKALNNVPGSRGSNGTENPLAGALIDAHQQFCSEQGVVASHARFVFVAFAGSEKDRNLIVEDIYDAVWSNWDALGLVTVIYYGNGQGVVDKTSVAKSILLKMREEGVINSNSLSLLHRCHCCGSLTFCEKAEDSEINSGCCAIL